MMSQLFKCFVLMSFTNFAAAQANSGQQTGTTSQSVADETTQEEVFERALSPVLLSHSECRADYARIVAAKANDIPLLEAATGVPIRNDEMNFLIEVNQQQTPAVRFRLEAERTE
jgi:hypothetical protein